MYTILKFNGKVPTVFRYESKSKKVLKDLINETLYGKVKYDYAKELKESELKIVKITPGILDKMPKIPLKIIREYCSFKYIVNDEQYNAEISRSIESEKEHGWREKTYEYHKRYVDAGIIKEIDYFALIAAKPKEEIKKYVFDILTLKQQKLFKKSFDAMIDMSLHNMYLSWIVVMGSKRLL
jgi:hypothetical protein